ncbi:TetR/AcrR family transcriptional regulator [Patulibacter defluvii]|uniref:TetR/AcrR family transcriptional regulator n=1 Tax=Patulibacter defluvii TaxID=3095358 RepID=UPI002A749176|nr:TetR/AcrR family transcriptional regulator [Patulibacter sp. DM4]
MGASDTTRPYHHGNLREALLRRAEATLEESGVAGLSLRAIARDVGVSHAAPRRHFADRQALLDALAEDGFLRLAEEVRAAVAEPAGGFVERLGALANVYVSFATQHAALLDLMFAGKHRPGAAESLYAAAEAAFAPVFQVIVDGQAEGEVVPGDVERVALAAWAGIHGLAAMANAGLVDRATLPSLVGDVAERMVLGLRPRG